MRFTLWNENAHCFRKTEYEQAEKPVIMAVSSCLVKDYGGKHLNWYLTLCLLRLCITFAFLNLLLNT